jgi:PTS system mannose-specific IID component
MHAFLIALVTGFAYWSRRFLGDFYIERPIILGPLVGLICGDLQTGLVVGGTLELIFMGAVDIGGSVPSNYAIGSAIGTYFAITAKLSLEEALAIAIPAALVGSFFEVFAKTIGVFFVNAAEKLAEKSDVKGIARLTHLGNLAHGLAYAIPVFLAISVGQEVVSGFMAGVPEWFRLGMSLAGKTLPALGFALLLSSLAINKLIPFFFIGFFVAAYTTAGVVGTSVLAVLVAIVLMAFRADNSASLDDLDGSGAAEVSGNAQSVLEPGDVKTLFWRSFAIQSSFSFDRMQAMGFTWGLLPILKREYKNDPAGLSDALKRHLSFYNTFPWLSSSPLVLAAEMEIKKARGQNVDGQAIQGFKSALMGPLAGIGDSMFHGTARPIIGGICASLALNGTSAAPFIFLVVIIALHCGVRWWIMQRSLAMGDKMFGMFSSAKVRNFMEGAMITGLMATGALVATWLNFTTPLTYVKDGAEISIQNMFNGIFPKILPLGLTMLVFFFVRKGVKTTYIMLGLIAASIVLGALKIFA